MPKLSRRAEALGTENAFVVLAEVNRLIRDGADIVSFCIGQPDFPTPVHVQDAAVEAVRGGRHGYTPSAGIDELRAAAAQSMGKLRGLVIEPDEVVVGAGAKPFIGYTIASVTDCGAGDEVIYPVPGFPIYESQIVANGAVPVALPLTEARGFAFDPAALEARIGPKTRLLILNTPHNPTGGLLTRTDLEAIAAVLQRHPDVWVYADEIYSKLVYDGEFVSIAALPGMRERTIISDGASKTYAMTGWRIGYACGPQELIAAMTKMQSQSTSNACSIAQKAAVEAIAGSQDPVAVMAEEFEKRRTYIVQRLNAMPGVTCFNSTGAFYAFPNFSALYGKSFNGKVIGDSTDLAGYLLEEARVALVPGVAFGDDRYARLSYAIGMDNIAEGMDRIERAIRNLN